MGSPVSRSLYNARRVVNPSSVIIVVWVRLRPHPTRLHREVLLELVPSQNFNRKGHNGKSKQTHCQNGHPFSVENTYISPKSRKRTCITCNKERVKRLWHENLEDNRREATARMRQWRKDNRERYNRKWKEDRRIKKQWLDEQKLAGCSRCPEKDPCCIDFHHTDPTQKEGNLSVKVAHWSIAKLQEEIAKTILLCSNCHRKLHAAEREKDIR
jgi:hypothetical protein